MKDIFKDEKKIFRYFWAVVMGVCLIIAFYQVSSDLPKFLGWLGKVLDKFIRVITPIVVGSVIAYLLKNPGRKMEKLLLKIRFFAHSPKRAHTVAVLLTSFLAMALLVGFLFAVIPNTVDSISLLISRMTDLRVPLERLYYRLSRNDLFVKIMDVFHIDIVGSDPGTLIMELIGMGQKYLSSLGTYIYSFALDTGTFLYNFVIGFVISVYMNLEWDQLKKEFEKAFRALLGRRYDRVSYIAGLFDRTFTVYIEGKITTSAVIGLLACIFCLIFRVPYAPMIGLIWCVSNVIPIAGPWIGGIICGLISLLAGVDKMIIVLIIVEAGQILDNNILTPMVLGDMVDLSGFWVFVAVIVSGSVCGVFGMIVAIPFFSVIKTLIDEAIDNRLVSRRVVTPDEPMFNADNEEM